MSTSSTSPQHITYSEAEKQAEWLTSENIDGGAQSSVYDPWLTDYNSPNHSNTPAPELMGQWLVNTEHQTTGVSCGLVKSRRDSYGDQEAAKMCRDEFEPKEAA
jgi:hypothetical protein